MSNKLIVFLVTGLLLFVGLGCGITDRLKQISDEATSNSNAARTDANKSIGDQITEDVLREKTGVPECDEVLNFFADQTKSSDDNFVTKATKEFVFNKIRQSLKESIEKNKNDKEAMAKNCREYKKQLDAAIAEQENKK